MHAELFAVSVEEFLKEVHKQLFTGTAGVHAVPTGLHIRDDEQVSTHTTQVVCGENIALKCIGRYLWMFPSWKPP